MKAFPFTPQFSPPSGDGFCLHRKHKGRASLVHGEKTPQVCAEDSETVPRWGKVAGSVAPSVSPGSPFSCGSFSHSLSCPHHAALGTDVWAKTPLLSFCSSAETVVPPGLAWNLNTHTVRFPAPAVASTSNRWAHLPWGGSVVQALFLVSMTFCLPPASGPQAHKGHDLFLSTCRSCPLSTV